MTRFVLDATTAASWVLAWERHDQAAAVLHALTGEAEAVVPASWPYELAEILNAAVERDRLSREGAEEFGELLSALPITVEPSDPRRVFGRVRSLALRHQLAVEESAYLEVAVREGLPLATVEHRLAMAADRAGVPLFVGAGDFSGRSMR